MTRTAQPIEQWPFQQMVAQGMADAIMTAHLVNRHVDPVWPVTLSEKFIPPNFAPRYDLGSYAATWVREAIERGELSTEQVD